MLSLLHKKKMVNIHRLNPEFVTKFVAKEENALNSKNDR